MLSRSSNKAYRSTMFSSDDQVFELELLKFSLSTLLLTGGLEEVGLFSI